MATRAEERNALRRDAVRMLEGYEQMTAGQREALQNRLANAFPATTMLMRENKVRERLLSSAVIALKAKDVQALAVTAFRLILTASEDKLVEMTMWAESHEDDDEVTKVDRQIVQLLAMGGITDAGR